MDPKLAWLTGFALHRVGDAVFGQVMGGMGSHVIADPQTLVPMPQNLSAVQAATIPTAFLTAYECLMVAAKIRKGSCVLAHAATGSQLPCSIQDSRYMQVAITVKSGSLVGFLS